HPWDYSGARPEYRPSMEPAEDAGNGQGVDALLDLARERQAAGDVAGAWEAVSQVAGRARATQELDALGEAALVLRPPRGRRCALGSTPSPGRRWCGPRRRIRDAPASWPRWPPPATPTSPLHRRSTPPTWPTRRRPSSGSRPGWRTCRIPPTSTSVSPSLPGPSPSAPPPRSPSMPRGVTGGGWTPPRSWAARSSSPPTG